MYRLCRSTAAKQYENWEMVKGNSQSPVRRIRVKLTQNLLHFFTLQRPLHLLHPPLIRLRLSTTACCSDSRLAQECLVLGPVRLELRVRIERSLARGERGGGGGWFGRGEKSRVGDEEGVQLGDG